jgi:hypothetical protein
MIIIQYSFQIMHLCHNFSSVLLSLKFICSICVSYWLPESHYLSFGDFSVSSSFGLWSANYLYTFFPVPSLILQMRSPSLHILKVYMDVFNSPPHAQGSIYVWKMEQGFTTVLVLFATITTPGFTLFYVNWATDVLLLQNASKLFHMFSGKRSLSKFMLK